MKKITLLLMTAMVSFAISAQETVELPECVKVPEGMEKDAYYEAVAFQSKLPKEFYSKEIAIVFAFDRISNALNLIGNKKKSIGYNCLKMTDIANSYIEEAGLNVSQHIITEFEVDKSGKYKYNKYQELDDLKEFKKAGIEYLVVVNIGENLFHSVQEGFEYNKEFAKDFRVVIYELNSKVYYGSTLEKLPDSEYAKASNYHGVDPEYRVSEDLTFNKLEMSATEFKDKEIYYVLYPKLVLPSSKPKGLGCKMMLKSNKLTMERYLESNEAAQELLPKSGLNVKIVDSNSELPVGEDAFHLIHYHITITTYDASGNADRESTDYFFLLNLKTYDVFIFDEGSLSFEKYLKDILKEING